MFSRGGAFLGGQPKIPFQKSAFGGPRIRLCILGGAGLWFSLGCLQAARDQGQLALRTKYTHINVPASPGAPDWFHPSPCRPSSARTLLASWPGLWHGLRWASCLATSLSSSTHPAEATLKFHPPPSLRMQLRWPTPFNVYGALVPSMATPRHDQRRRHFLGGGGPWMSSCPP